MEENKKMEVELDWLPEGYRTDEINGGIMYTSTYIDYYQHSLTKEKIDGRHI